MTLGRPSRRSILCVAFAAILAVVLPNGLATAQWKGPPADRAEELWRQGYVLHVLGAYRRAVVFFERSIEARPTAEGHTYLGWSLSHLGQIEAAIAECKTAIDIDPDFGNPYNDIGVYLIELKRLDEAVPWLEKAAEAKRYCCYQYPHFNLGRIHLKRGELPQAKRRFEQALQYDPDYVPAKLGLEEIRNDWL